jgi:hypothetical protein
MSRVSGSVLASRGAGALSEGLRAASPNYSHLHSSFPTMHGIARTYGDASLHHASRWRAQRHTRATLAVQSSVSSNGSGSAI